MKCCRSTPRCRACPARQMGNARVLRALGIEPEPPLPPHLSGIPASLHKYEPLLRRAWLEAGSERYSSPLSSSPSRARNSSSIIG
jgi:hypothetical protein